ncbi:MAG: hypothetical protein RLZZ366_1372 [Pseudomonadota bacterium]
MGSRLRGNDGIADITHGALAKQSAEQPADQRFAD